VSTAQKNVHFMQTKYTQKYSLKLSKQYTDSIIPSLLV